MQLNYIDEFETDPVTAILRFSYKQYPEEYLFAGAAKKYVFKNSD